MPVVLKPAILSLEGAIETSREAQEWGMKVVLTNGCFDILHRGHLEYLRASAELGNILMVGVNSNASVRALKGPGRPRNSVDDRMELLISLRFVDFAFTFEGDCFMDAITRIRPNVYTKGGDYEDKRLKLSESEALKEVEADVRILPLTEGFSTTKILKHGKPK